MTGTKRITEQNVFRSAALENDEESKMTLGIPAWVTGWSMVTFVKIVNAKKSKFGRER